MVALGAAMGRCHAEDLEHRELRLVYIAGNVRDAGNAERLLTTLGVDYALDLESFTKGALFGGEYVGLFFYVPTEQYAVCKEYLVRHGMSDVVELTDEA